MRGRRQDEPHTDKHKTEGQDHPRMQGMGQGMWGEGRYNVKAWACHKHKWWCHKGQATGWAWHLEFIYWNIIIIIKEIIYWRMRQMEMSIKERRKWMMTVMAKGHEMRLNIIYTFTIITWRVIMSIAFWAQAMMRRACFTHMIRWLDIPQATRVPEFVSLTTLSYIRLLNAAYKG